MRYLLITFFLIVLVFPEVNSKSAEEWRSRIIYQLLTDRFSHSDSGPPTKCTDLRSYCGGTFKGIQKRLDYIQGLGANAVWISPMVANTHLGYHGYWTKNLFEVNPEFGTREDLLDLIKACHERDIWVMMDIVANHMGYPEGCFWDGRCENTPQKLTNVTGFVPFNRPEHYHPYCKIHWDRLNFTEVEDCWLADLPDFKQENQFVRTTLLDWIANLTRDYGFDGYRIDTVVEVPHEFWGEFQKASGVFCIGEANLGTPHISYIASYQNYMDSVLNFPTYWGIRMVFNEGKPMTEMTRVLAEQRKHFRDTTVLGQFVDNHDFPRFLNLSSNLIKLKNALAYIVLAEGIPFIYYGTEQAFSGGHDPDNRESLWPFYDNYAEIYKFIKGLTSFRQTSGVDFTKANQLEHYVDHDTLVFSRNSEKKILVVISSNGSSATFTRTLRRVVGFQDKTVFQNSAQDEKLILENGALTVTFYDGEPQIFTVTEPKCPTGSAKSSSYTAFVLLYVMVYHLIKWL